MKRILLAAGLLALAGSIGAAEAADLSRPPPAMPTKAPYFVPYYNWTGFYVGVNGGGAWGNSAWSGLIPSSFTTSGGLLGGTVGYNWQFGQFVWGLEGDADWTDMRGTANIAACAGFVCRTRNDWLSTARGRVGYAIDRFMPYVTGGLAVGNIRATNPFGGVDSTNAGWTAGAGVEVAIAGPWTAKVEYLHVDLGNANCGLACGFPVGGNTVSLTSEVVRGGINYRF
jgi:outer membrane immunogenic protein